jgi:hypothetical protein
MHGQMNHKVTYLILTLTTALLISDGSKVEFPNGMKIVTVKDNDCVIIQ